MLWLCIHTGELPLECAPPPAVEAAAVADRIGNRRILVTVNAAARAMGIAPGLEATAASAILPTLRLIPRSLRREQEAIRSLCGWAEQFASTVTSDPARLLLWLEAGPSLKYFQGVAPLRAKVATGLAALGYTATIGIAPTPESAALLAQQGSEDWIPAGVDLGQALAAFPTRALALSADCRETFEGLGMTRIGDILALPRDALARRFGPKVSSYLARLIGEIPDPRIPHRSPERFRRRFELLGTVESTEALLFPLRRLLSELQAFLHRREAAVQEVALAFEHDSGPPTEITLRSTLPLRDAATLGLLARERFERLELRASVEALVLTARRLVVPRDGQGDLFGAGSKDGQWAAVVDKLRARLGDAAVHGLGLASDHRPEKAWSTETTVGAAEGPPLPDWPLWLLAEPRPIRPPTGELGRPQRIEAGWWEFNDTSRDYHTVTAANGARLWLFRDNRSQKWFLQGLWG